MLGSKMPFSFFSFLFNPLFTKSILFFLKELKKSFQMKKIISSACLFFFFFFLAKFCLVVFEHQKNSSVFIFFKVKKITFSFRMCLENSKVSLSLNFN